jgi:TonB family protein
VFGLVVLFGAVAGGAWYWIRTQNAARPTPAAPPVAEATPTAVPATPEPTPEPVVEETPVAEATAEPAPEAAASASPGEATLQLRSQPEGATVFVGRKKRGVTPLRLRLPPGSVSLRVEKDGYRPWTSDTRLKAGESRTLEARLEAVAAAAPPPTAAPPPPPAAPAVREGDLVALTGDVTPPRKVKSASPNVPSIAHRKRLAGSVLLEFVVGIDGRVEDVKVVESAHEVLDKAAIEAVQQWRYEPATSHGVKVRVTQRARFTFQAS